MDNKKTVLVDMTLYNDLSGFGEIDRNFGPKLKNPPDIRFVFLVWAKDVGVLGQDKHYVTMENLKRDIKALGFDIDLWHSTDQIFFTRKRMKTTKYLLTVHDLNFLYEKRGIHRLKHLLRMKWRVAHSDYITVISKYVKHDLLSHIDVGGKPVEVVYNGIRDMANAPQAKPKFIEDEGERFFFTIGQIREKKNFHLLIPMMRHFPGTKLYICGLMNKHFKDRFMEIYNAENPGNVVLTGGISDAERTWMYAHCAAFLFPSKLEGFGLPVLEAMQFGRKVFSSRLSSLPEVCGSHATYWDSFDPKGMAGTVEQGLRGWDNDGPEAQSERSYAIGFSYERFVQSYLSIYRRMLGLPPEP